ncbi:MAG: helix-turn-helix transcriptional regulator [Clostridia bacterium]|nr:helix-turn-helix transcriptional regulator [Clostridia bacterium]
MELKFEKEQNLPVFRITALVNAAYYTLPEDFSFEGESHDFWELGYVDRGQVAVRQGENSYLLKSGEMMLYKPNTFHNCRVWQGKPAAMVNIAFEVEGVFAGTFGDEIIALGAEERQCMSAIIREASQTYVHFENLPAEVGLERLDSAPYGSRQIICNRLEELLIYACRNEKGIRIDRRLIPAEMGFDRTETSERIRGYLREYYPEKLTLDRIARDNCISTTKLKRVFRQETGSPVIAYLTELRIKEAKQLIRRGRLNFSQIAEAVGFDTVHYFSAVFKKHTGLTPTEYARSLHKK